METYRVKKIHCLVCDTILKLPGTALQNVIAKMKQKLDNSFRFKTPNSIISSKR